MRCFWTTLPKVALALLLVVPVARAPAQTAPKASTPMQKPSAPMPPPASAQPRQRVVVVEPIRVFDPFYDYPYPYAYAPEYMSENFGYVKLESGRCVPVRVVLSG